MWNSDFQAGGNPLFHRAGLLNHQISKISINSIWMKFFCECFKFAGFKVDFRFPGIGDPLIPPGPGC
jgi:hypothetical protein